LLKHGSPWQHPVALPPPAAQPSLEAQVADTADEIAYINHDLDDGLGSGLLVPERLEEVALWSETLRSLREQLGGVPERVLRAQVVVALINRLVTDLIEAVSKRVDARGLASVDAVRACPERLVQFSALLEKPKRELKKFLYEELYQHPQVLAMNERAVGILGDLFAAFRRDPGRLPEHVRARIPGDGEARAIADYVAGMTDRFAMDEHAKLGARRG
ncbi:MAG TPA: deoxyguanosinetriphosphate triphosphohydrolase, partial [Myxococcota bacterium]